MNIDGSNISFAQALGRTFCRFIPFEVFSFLDSRPRGWHDSIPKTKVINLPSPLKSSEEIHPEKDRKHSGFGIASFVISLLSGMLIFIFIGIAQILESPTPGELDEESMEVIVMGLFMIGSALLSIVALSMGIVQKAKKKVFAVLGVIFSGVILLGFLLLILGALLIS